MTKPDSYRIARKRMIDEQLISRGIKDQRILIAMMDVPRHLFVALGMETQAYEDRPLPIGYEQTISQPFIVAYMTEALMLKGSERVLEIGTGSGYQAAILAQMVEEVFTIERVSSLSIKARQVIYKLPNARRVKFKIGDGSIGWPEMSPFDSIMVTAAAPSAPMKLCEQLKDGGRLVIPIGGEDFQVLTRIIKRGNNLVREELTGCRFVKLLGEDGWK